LSMGKGKNGGEDHRNGEGFHRGVRYVAIEWVGKDLWRSGGLSRGLIVGLYVAGACYKVHALLLQRRLSTFQPRKRIVCLGDVNGVGGGHCDPHLRVLQRGLAS
jgi:hypothetical protein